MADQGWCGSLHLLLSLSNAENRSEEAISLLTVLAFALLRTNILNLPISLNPLPLRRLRIQLKHLHLIPKLGFILYINNKKCHKSILNWTYFWSASLRVFLCLRFHIPMSVLLAFCHLHLASKTPMVALDCLLWFCGLVELFDLMMDSSLRTDGSLVDHCSGCYNALSLVWAFQLSQRIQRINPPFLSASCTVPSCQDLAHTRFPGPVNEQSR